MSYRKEICKQCNKEVSGKIPLFRPARRYIIYRCDCGHSWFSWLEEKSNGQK